MPVGAYMLSILKRQASLLGPTFVEQHPDAWLVWEPGPWRPAVSVLSSNNESTRLPGQAGPSRPAGEDAICFELTLRPGDTMLSVGRATDNDVVINDLTASRDQFTLERSSGKWHLTVHGVPLTLNRQPVEQGKPLLLSSGDVLQAGEVLLTYLDAEGMAARVERANRASG